MAIAWNEPITGLVAGSRGCASGRRVSGTKSLEAETSELAESKRRDSSKYATFWILLI